MNFTGTKTIKKESTGEKKQFGGCEGMCHGGGEGMFHGRDDFHHEVEDVVDHRETLPLDLKTDDFHPNTMLDQPVVEQPVVEPHFVVHPPPPIEEPVITHVEEPTPIIHHVEEPPPVVHHEIHEIHHDEPVLLPVPIAAPAPPPPPPCTVHIPVTVHLKGKLAIKMKHCQKCDFSKNIESIGPLKISSLSQLEEKLKERLDKSFKVKKSAGTKKHKLHKKPIDDSSIHKRDQAMTTVIDFDKLDHLNEKLIFGDDEDKDEVTGTKKDLVSAGPGHDLMVRKSVNLPGLFIPSAAYKRGVIISLPKGKAMLKCVVPKEKGDKKNNNHKKDTKPEEEDEKKVSFSLNPTPSGPVETKSITPDVAATASEAVESNEKSVENTLTQQHLEADDVVTLSSTVNNNADHSTEKASTTRQQLASLQQVQQQNTSTLEDTIQKAVSPTPSVDGPLINPNSFTTTASQSNNKFANNFMKVLDKDMLVSLYKMACLLYTSPSPRDATLSRMPSSA